MALAKPARCAALPCMALPKPALCAALPGKPACMDAPGYVRQADQNNINKQNGTNVSHLTACTGSDFLHIAFQMLTIQSLFGGWSVMAGVARPQRGEVVAILRRSLGL